MTRSSPPSSARRWTSCGHGPVSTESWERFAPMLRAARLGDGFEALGEAVPRAAEEVGGDPRLLHYLSLPPSAHAEVIEGLGRCGPRPPRPDHPREAVRDRPRLGAVAGRAPARYVRGGAGLPHRPLPRPGRGPEPPRDAVRQRDVRAGLEPEQHQPRPDRRPRDALGSGCGPASTSRRAPSGTWSSPTSSRCSGSSRWSRRTRSTRSR